MPRPSRLLLVGIVILSPITLWLMLAINCPSAGIALTSLARHLHRLKNRTSLPKATDFDSRITLDALLQPGDDTNRWSTDRAGRIQGEVIDVAYAGPEATNCFSPCRRDIHILIATRKEATKSEHVVVEVTPNLRAINWSEETLQNS